MNTLQISLDSFTSPFFQAGRVEWGGLMKKIKLTQGKYALVDNEDYEWLNQRNWHFSRNGGNRGGYAHGQEKGERIIMHRLLMGNPPKELEVDHVNGSRLDNRRKNLRVCSIGQNQKNRGKSANNTSGFKGVHKSEENHWIAQIQLDGVRHHLGTFATKEDAARAYNKAAKIYHREFARLNIIKKQPYGKQ